ncbi:hypothetical protein [Ktedonospora formicarum]|uniref:hypothetical protein n=1 Tax=Ktedonospora formicarum TaxID=2778364 RepID=UPI001C69322C|nr:hypothetical protein [Ktedonospora formicarum]
MTCSEKHLPMPPVQAALANEWPVLVEVLSLRELVVCRWVTLFGREKRYTRVVRNSGVAIAEYQPVGGI